MKLQIEPKHLEIVKQILNQELGNKHLVGDYQVILFGSRVTGTNKATSDLDIAVIGESQLPLSVRSKLELAFSESNLPYFVDIVDYNSSDVNFQKLIKTTITFSN